MKNVFRPFVVVRRAALAVALWCAVVPSWATVTPNAVGGGAPRPVKGENTMKTSQAVINQAAIMVETFLWVLGF
ncbi:hypothetical protein ACPOL_7217 (plasmid) [Acidisarcina polymorpha]|uniref:Uncharacterized protein n=1 Tax=Acidisarcina polymorpha TaxID=2211140 RepID=A0A2Z5GC80_9BACT|nr:hypothetical protein [Acidisarcina polymorpha]AXC16407.1 hypothetical protein ACPOL_7217 [Acidisarcina polymorpha]